MALRSQRRLPFRHALRSLCAHLPSTSTDGPDDSHWLRWLRSRDLVAQTFPSQQGTLPTEGPVLVRLEAGTRGLHLGHLPLLRALWEAGRRGGPRAHIVLGTTSVTLGDPGLPEEAEAEDDFVPVSLEEARENAAAMRGGILRLWERLGGEAEPPEIRTNCEWLEGLDVVDFLSVHGRDWRLSELLANPAVQRRLGREEQRLSLSQLLQPLFAALDWSLAHPHCRLLLVTQEQANSLPTAVAHMRGRGEYGALAVSLASDSLAPSDQRRQLPDWAVGLDGLSPYLLYQHCVRKPDAELPAHLRRLTDLPEDRIVELIASHEPWEGQKELGRRVTEWVHGPGGLGSALRCTAALFGGGALGELSAAELSEVFREAASATLDFRPDATLQQIALDAGVFKSPQEASRIIAEGGLYVNQERVRDPSAVLGREVLLGQTGHSLLRRGKRNYYIVQWTGLQ